MSSNAAAVPEHFGTCWILEGLPSPLASRGRVDRRRLEEEVRGLGFSVGPRLAVNRFFLDVAASEADRAALNKAISHGGIRLCGYDVVLKAASEVTDVAAD